VIKVKMMTQGAASAKIGQPIPRKEDQRLTTGRGRFSDDMSLPGQVHAVMLRSPHAHAHVHLSESLTPFPLPAK
jgi:carbon-monoxide dehydrogenase large subunit